MPTSLRAVLASAATTRHGLVVPLRGRRPDEVLTTPEGVVATITVRFPEDPVVAPAWAAFNAALSAVAKLQDAKVIDVPELTAAMLRQRDAATSLYAVSVAAWDFDEAPTEGAVKELMAALPWVRVLIDKAVADAARFFESPDSPSDAGFGGAASSDRTSTAVPSATT